MTAQGAESEHRGTCGISRHDELVPDCPNCVAQGYPPVWQESTPEMGVWDRVCPVCDGTGKAHIDRTLGL
jgi:DnaJ-class molecular chaperone